MSQDMEQPVPQGKYLTAVGVASLPSDAPVEITLIGKVV